MNSANDVVLAVLAALIGVLAMHWLGWRLVRLLFAGLRRLPPHLTGPRRWLAEHELRLRAKARYPNAYRRVAKRFDPHSPVGLSLTLLMLAAAYLAALLGGLVEDVVENDSIVLVDHAVTEALQPWRSPGMMAAFNWITDLGTSAALGAAAAVGSALFWTYRRSSAIIPLWLTFLGSQATTYLGKYVIARPRPELQAGLEALTASFPSGHTTGAAAVYGFLAYAIAREQLPGSRPQFEIVFWTTLLILLVGFSRIFIGAHFVSDVLAGLLVGGFWLLVGFALANWLRRRDGLPARLGGSQVSSELAEVDR